MGKRLVNLRAAQEQMSHRFGAGREGASRMAPGSALSSGASASAVGEHIAFVEAPDLHTSAHEAVHALQQLERAGR